MKDLFDFTDSEFDDSELDDMGNVNPFIDLDDFEEPETWSIISALNRILDQARNSRLSKQFWRTCRRPLNFLNKELGLTDIQIVVLAILVEQGESMSWKQIGRFLNCSRLSVMVYSDEIEEMVKKRWFVRRGSREVGGMFEGFALAYGVVTALRRNMTFVPPKIDGLDIQQFMDMLEHHVEVSHHDHNISFKDEEEWMEQLCEANAELPLCREALKFKSDIHVLSLLLMVAVDYAEWADSCDEGLQFDAIDNMYPEDFLSDGIRRNLKTGRHPLIQAGLIEFKCEDGIACTDKYALTRKSKDELLAGYKPSKSMVPAESAGGKGLMKCSSIKEKCMFYNDMVEQQIAQLACMLDKDNLPAIQARLEAEGMRKGFACLFYGGPGTGKTETVLQIARQTGRDIMMVDIAGMRDKYVGESEKNIKAVFSRYRELCKRSEVMPILFFNEADALINKRSVNVEHSVDKMDNAMQNIILQELENLDGILIATTNLTENLDSAFERRFIYKVKFDKPDVSTMAKLWRSMMKNDLSEADAVYLASHYNFSGGQIENIARKRTVNFILTGKKADLNEIEDYCKTELLDNKKELKHIAGFCA